MTIALSIGYGLPVALIPIVALIAIVGVGRLVLWSRERRFRVGGPSWPARLPIVFARRLGGTVPTGWDSEMELLGRIYLRRDGLVWMPTPAQAKTGVGPVVLGPGW
jgi:hypothetical protein